MNAILLQSICNWLKSRILISVWNRWTAIRLLVAGIRLFPHESKGAWVSRFTHHTGSETLSIWFVFADGQESLYGTIYWKIQPTNRWIGYRHANDSIVRPKSIRISSPTTITKAIQPIRQSIQYTKCKAKHFRMRTHLILVFRSLQDSFVHLQKWIEQC